MTDRFNLFEHTIAVERCRHGWCASVWRSQFDDRGVITGVVKIGDISSWSKTAVTHRARRLARKASRRGERWPRQPAV